MPGVRLREGETFDGALRRFKKQCEKAGVLREARRREFYEKPSVRKKKKAITKSGEKLYIIYNQAVQVSF